ITVLWKPAWAEIVELAGAGRDGELLLVDGRVLRLAALAVPVAVAEAAAARVEALSTAGMQIDPAGVTDRWGRLLVAPSAPDGVDLALDLLRAGLAIVLPAGEAGSVPPELWRAEAEARATRIGICRLGFVQDAGHVV